MEMLPVASERKAQLAATDEVLETVAAVAAYEDVKAGRTQSAEDFLKDLRDQHGVPL